MKFILTLRDTVDRLHSDYSFNVSTGSIQMGIRTLVPGEGLMT